MKKTILTHFLKLVLVCMGAGVLALSIFALPAVWNGASEEFPDASRAVFLIVIGMYATVILFFVALQQSGRVLRHIEKNTFFSIACIKIVRTIKYCGIGISALYVGGVPLLFPIAQADDAPGLILMGMIVAGIPIAGTALVALLEKILQEVVDGTTNQ